MKIFREDRVELRGGSNTWTVGDGEAVRNVDADVDGLCSIVGRQSVHDVLV
jgi:hypothetical protein